MESNVTQYLAEHPRLMGVLFTAYLLVASAGTVVATQGGGTVAGP